MLNNYREDSGKFRVDCIKTVQIYECFLDLNHLFKISFETKKSFFFDR